VVRGHAAVGAGELGRDRTQVKCSIRAKTAFLSRDSRMTDRPAIHAAPVLAQQHCSGRHSLLCLLPVIERHLPEPFNAGEELTRDYCCRTIEQLADLLLVRIEQDVPIDVEGDVYIK